jgi:NAD(P)-dependent dehydrogenase (short-subunit alcohol dehydrogenase family)
VAAEITREGGAALVFASDVANVEDAQRAVDLTVSTFGALHGAVNNAGVASESHELPSMPIDVWSDTIAVNLSAQFYGMRAQIPAIQRSGGGAIVNVSSVFADRGMRGRAAYSSSKHALRGLTRSAALEWAPRGVRINELQPGVIDTPMTAEGGEEENKRIAAIIAAQRTGQPREVASAIAFLLSEEASYIMGAHLAVDGGFLA